MLEVKRRTVDASIIIPLYNCERYIGQVIDFLIIYNKKYNTEIIVINDASNDSSLTIINKYKDQIRIVDLQKNSGRSFARNKGIDAAYGNVLIFLDADCLPQDESFFKLHLGFHQRYCGALNGKVTFPKRLLNTNDRYLKFRNLGFSANGLMKVSPDAFATGNVSVKKIDILQVGGFDETMEYFEDVDMGIRLANSGLTIFTNDEILVDHLDSRVTLSRDMKRNYVAYGQSVNRIIEKNKDNIAYLPLVKLFHAKQRSWMFDFFHSYGVRYIYAFYLAVKAIMPRQIANRLFDYLLVSAAFNGYYRKNRDFFLSLK